MDNLNLTKLNISEILEIDGGLIIGRFTDPTIIFDIYDALEAFGNGVQDAYREKCGC